LALACFLEAKKLAPVNVQIALIDSNLGGVYIQMGRMAEAERALLASLERKPVAEAYNNLGAAYYYQGKYMESAEAMKKAVELGKTDPQLLGGLATMYMLTNRRSEAEPLFEEAIRKAEEQLRVNPADADLLTELALIRAETGDGSRALKHVEEARKREPENNDVLFRSVLVYERTGNRRLALKAIEEMLRRGPLMWEIELDPVLAELRQDPGYKALVSGSSTRKTNRTP
jgi:tetratricopeptide (TPR) repeat protein